MLVSSKHGIQNVIFDCDGVIIDSEPYWHAAELKAYNAAGINISYEDVLRNTGKRPEESVAESQQLFKFDNIVAQTIVADIYAAAKEEIHKHAQPMAGLYDALELLLANNITLAIASCAPINIIKIILEKLQIKDVFKVIHSAENEEYGKPHPAVYLTAKAMLNADASRCFVIEDSFYGLIAAKAARLPCVLIDEQKKRHFGCIADKVIVNLTEIDHALLQELSRTT